LHQIWRELSSDFTSLRRRITKSASSIFSRRASDRLWQAKKPVRQSRSVSSAGMARPERRRSREIPKLHLTASFRWVVRLTHFADDLPDYMTTSRSLRGFMSLQNFLHFLGFRSPRYADGSRG
jgi:hypothetical protein